MKEHDKVSALEGKNEVVGTFIEWLRSEGYSICRWEKKQVARDEEGNRVATRPEGYYPTNKDTQQLIADHFGIDYKKYLAEKDEVLNMLETR